jgi:transmembrane sensor
MVAFTSGVLPLLWADARTGIGEQRTFPLSDGSEIVLNTQAAVAVRYSDHTRRVDLLAGEAAFRVEKDAGRPFLVHTHDGQVRAVGTEFIVHKTAEAVLVTVTEGVVEVSTSRDRATVPTLVQVGQRVRYNHSGVGSVEPVDLRVVTAWQRGKLIFEATPLTLVVEEINRYRRGHIVVINSQLAQRLVSGVFDLQRLDAAVTTIERTLPITSTHFTDCLILFR